MSVFFLGKMQEHPWQKYPWQQHPWQQHPWQQYPWQDHPWQKYPWQKYPWQEWDGQQYPGQTYLNSEKYRRPKNVKPIKPIKPIIQNSYKHADKELDEIEQKTNKLIHGITQGAGIITATDTILQAIGKLCDSLPGLPSPYDDKKPKTTLFDPSIIVGDSICPIEIGAHAEFEGEETAILRSQIDQLTHDKKINKNQSESKEEAKNCVICLDNAIQTTFIPCGHVSCCLDCGLSLKNCPICRADITLCQKLFFS